MSRYLLDTNAFHWRMTSDSKLGPRARQLLASATEMSFSPLSIWELELKRLKGRIEHSEPFEPVGNVGLRELPITPEHAHAIGTVRVPHNDPFDRMILTQATVDRLTLVTADRALLGLGRPDVVDART